MKYYLSSYKIGSEESVKQLISLMPSNKKIAYVPNALDFSDDLARRAKSELADIEQLKSVGFRPEKFDLRDYFSNKDALLDDFSQFNSVYVRGGNVFVLRQAMAISGFDDLLIQIANESEDFLYSGYSAGVCILAPSLKGMELVDDPDISPYPQQTTTIWSGLNLLDFMIVPHYDSMHRESNAMIDVVEYYKKEGIRFKTLKDGDVIIVK